MALSLMRLCRNWCHIDTSSLAKTSRLILCHSSGQLPLSTGGGGREEEEEEGVPSAFSGCGEGKKKEEEEGRRTHGKREKVEGRMARETERKHFLEF